MRDLIIQAVSFCCFCFHLATDDRLDCMRNLPVWVQSPHISWKSDSFEASLQLNAATIFNLCRHLRLGSLKKPLRSTTGRANKRCTTFVYIGVFLECLLSCNVDESEELMSNLVIYRFNFLGSSAQKLPSMISVLSIFQPVQNVSPSYGPDALSESFRHVLLFLMPLNICLFLSTILKCIGWFVNMIFQSS